ncbi:MAG TPA: hypothetical protein VG095_10250, partial [Chthoniobacterales bacterium]|nr:hypothetical protein [Chthoniobacterales bacterium]
LQLLVVNRNGEAFESSRWPESNTYCTADAAPLIGCDTYRKYLAADAPQRREMTAIMWGPATAEARIRASYDRPHASEECDEDDAITPESFRPLMRIIRRVAGEKRVDELKRLLASLLHRPSSAA